MRISFGTCALVLLVGCSGVSKQLFTPSKEFDAYRAFRVADEQGPRLAKATAYLKQYPNGEWAEEVRTVYREEEPAYFAAAQQSYEDAVNYLTYLPNGPHAKEALATTTVYGQEAVDIETIDLLSKARRMDTVLERQSAQRKQVGEYVASAVGALTSDGVFGKPLEDTSPLLRRLMSGARTSWGRAPDRHLEKIRFLLPLLKKPPIERVATVLVTVSQNAKGIEEGRIEGADLFVRWAEADLARALDPEAPSSRKLAADHAREVLSGALEARLPAARCALETQEQTVVASRCGGWQAVAVMGARPGDRDVISIRGPQETAK